jgi:hypothetical protein
MPTLSLIDQLTERAGELARLHHQAEDARIEAQWQLVAAEVRQVVPEATALRLEGYETEQGLRLSLLQVLVDGEPAKLDVATWRQLEDTLDQLLLLIAELEAPEVIDGEQDHDLPDLTHLPGGGTPLTLPLPGDPVPSDNDYLERAFGYGTLDHLAGVLHDRIDDEDTASLEQIKQRMAEFGPDALWDGLVGRLLDRLEDALGLRGEEEAGAPAERRRPPPDPPGAQEGAPDAGTR